MQAFDARISLSITRRLIARFVRKHYRTARMMFAHSPASNPRKRICALLSAGTQFALARRTLSKFVGSQHRLKRSGKRDLFSAAAFDKLITKSLDPTAFCNSVTGHGDESRVRSPLND
jgi:hypothetical protein